MEEETINPTETQFVSSRREQKRRQEKCTINEGFARFEENDVYDTRIKVGNEYQAIVPAIECDRLDFFKFKVYGYDYVSGPSEPKVASLSYVKDEERNLNISVARRSADDYLEWKPIETSRNDIKVLCYSVGQFIRQTYKLELSEYEILEYYRICNMNKGFFLNTIHSDQSPFLEFIRDRRKRRATK